MYKRVLQLTAPGKFDIVRREIAPLAENGVSSTCSYGWSLTGASSRPHAIRRAQRVVAHRYVRSHFWPLDASSSWLR